MFYSSLVEFYIGASSDHYDAEPVDDAGLDKQDSNLDDGRRTELDQSCIDVLAPFKKPFAMYNSAPGRDRLDSAQLNKSPVTTFPKLSGWPVMRPHCGRMHHSVVSQ